MQGLACLVQMPQHMQHTQDMAEVLTIARTGSTVLTAISANTDQDVMMLQLGLVWHVPIRDLSAATTLGMEGYQTTAPLKIVRQTAARVAIVLDVVVRRLDLAPRVLINQEHTTTLELEVS